MTRPTNVFHRLVTNENSTTELVCNLMQFPVFSRLVLSRFLSRELASDIGAEDIDTQVNLADCGRADIVIDSDKAYIIIEAKIELGCSLTSNQPEGYFSHLLNRGNERERWLVFLVPKGWAFRPPLQQKLDFLETTHRESGIRAAILEWDDILALIEEHGLDQVSPFFRDFRELLDGWFRPRPIHFSYKEANMLYSKDVPKALTELAALVDEIEQKGGRTYMVTRSRERKTFPSERGLWFSNTRGNSILYFGMWPDFWKDEGFPLCFGVDAKSVPDLTEAFRTAYKGDIRHFQDRRWSLGYISKETLLSDRAGEEVWNQLEPILDALSKAAIQKTVPK